MRIDRIVIPVAIQNKLISKHGVTVEETRFVLLNQPRIRFAEKGHQEGENVYAAFGQTFGGRYLVLYFVYKPLRVRSELTLDICTSTHPKSSSVNSIFING